MAKITFKDKVDTNTNSGVNYITADNVNEIKNSVNALYDTVANINTGGSVDLSTIESNIADLQTQLQALTTTVNAIDLSIYAKLNASNTFTTTSDTVATFNNSKATASYINIQSGGTTYTRVGRPSSSSKNSEVAAVQGDLLLNAKSGNNVQLGNNLNANSKTIYGLPTPTADNHASTKAYTDSIKTALKTELKNLVANAATFDELKTAIGSW